MKNNPKSSNYIGRAFVDSLKDIGPVTKMSEHELLARQIVSQSGGGSIIYPENAVDFRRVLRGEGRIAKKSMNGVEVSAFVVWTEQEKADFLKAQEAKRQAKDRRLELLKKHAADLDAPAKDAIKAAKAAPVAVTSSAPKRSLVTA